MQPNQPQNNPYYFLNNSPAPKNNMAGNLLGDGKSMKSRIITVVVGIIILIILYVVVTSLLSASSNAENKNLLYVIEDQGVLSSIAKSGLTNSTNLSIQNLSATTSLSVISSQSQFVGLLVANGVGVTKDNVIFQNPVINQSLKSAQQNGAFDQVFLTSYNQTLSTYQQTLKNAFKNAKPSEKTLINNFYNQSLLLQKESSSIPSTGPVNQ